jgi:hypothetical protein
MPRGMMPAPPHRARNPPRFWHTEAAAACTPAVDDEKTPGFVQQCGAGR